MPLDGSGTTAAVVLAGGTSRRLGGTDKTRLLVGGVPLLDRVLAVLPQAAEVVVVGLERPVGRPVRFVREEPPGGGPLAALGAALPFVTAERVWLLAADLPFLTAAALRALAGALGRSDGAMAIDDTGRDQRLLSLWWTASLRSALPSDPGGAPLRRAFDGLTVSRVELSGDPPPWWDCDTPQALARAREWTGREGPARLP